MDTAFSITSIQDEMDNPERKDSSSVTGAFSAASVKKEMEPPVEAAEATPTVADVEAFSVNEVEAEEVKEMTEDDWVLDESFIQDAKVLQEQFKFLSERQGADDYMKSQQGIRIGPDDYPSIEELQAGMKAGQESFEGFSDEEYAKGLMSRLGQLNWNLPDLGLTAMGIEDWPEEAQVALIRSMERYDAMPTELRHVGRGLMGVATDPSSYLGFTAFGNAMSKFALKGSATSVLKKALASPTAVAAVEGAAYTAADDVFKQAIDNKGDFSKNNSAQTYKAAAFGLGLSGTLGYTLNKVFGVSPAQPRVNEEQPKDLLELDPPDELSDQAERLNLEPPSNALPEPDDVPLEGKLVEDEAGLPVKSEQVPEDSPIDGAVDSMNNATDIPNNRGVGEDWYHLNNGKKTLNTARLETADDVKGFLESASAQIQAKRMGPPESLEESRRLADEEAQKLFEETGGDITEILNKYANDHEELKVIRHRAQQLRRLNVELGERIIELSNKDGITIAEKAELVEKAALFANTMEMSKLASREFARGLGNYRLTMSGDATLIQGLHTGTANGDVDALIKTIKQMQQAGQRKNADAATAGVDKVTNLKELKKSLSREKLTGVLQEIIRFRSAMMLSGPSTIEAAALSNITRLWTEPFWEWAGNIGAGSAKKKARMRAAAQWAGNKRFARDALKLAARAWKNGQHITDPFVTKLEGQQDAPLYNMSSARRNIWERGIHQAHLALMFLDEAVKAGRSRSLIYADTVVEAAERGIKDEADFDKLLQFNINSKIDSNGRVTDAEIIKEIRETTFTSDLEGPIGIGLTKLANSGGGAGRLIVPFIRAPINILSEGLTYFPGSQLISSKQKRIAREGSDVEKAKLKARRVFGSAAIMGLYYAAEENLITGNGPSDYKLKQALMATGWRPLSIRVGDQWVSYSKLGPFSLLLGIVADTNFLINQDDNQSNVTDESLKVLGLAMQVVSTNILNKAYFQSIQQVMDATQDADAATAFFTNMATSFTPNLLAQINDDPNVREANTLLEKYQRRLPEWSDKLGKQYDFYGRPILKPRGDIPIMGFMFKNDDYIDDPVAREVYNLSDSIDRSILQKPPYSLGITNTDFRDVYDGDETESLYAKYNRFIGEVKDGRGLTLHDSLADLFSSDAYLRAPHSVEGDITSPKVKMIQKLVNSYRGMAKARMHEESPAFIEQVNSRNSRIQSIFN